MGYSMSAKLRKRQSGSGVLDASFCCEDLVPCLRMRFDAQLPHFVQACYTFARGAEPVASGVLLSAPCKLVGISARSDY